MPALPSNTDKIVDWLTTLDLNVLLSSLIALSGVILGIFINEHYKRKDRESLFSKEIFARKLGLYESLNEKMNKASEIAAEITENQELTKEEKEEIWNKTVTNILAFMDKNELYINENIAMHCMLTLTGIEGIQDLDEKNEQEQKDRFYEGIRVTKNLIREETGLKRLDNFFNKINKPSIESNYIKAYNEIKKAYYKGKRLP